ncbi:phospholipase D-like domain-containing protein [Lyngbya aestuarii]|uniref:phospholipase D-like domain-containing protein n=1 Tax=Lyngbya aestuarii TaxID=118322 RepID=UPI00403D8799
MILFDALIWWLGSLALCLVLLTLLIMYVRGGFRRRFKYHLKNLPSPATDEFAFTVAGLSDSFVSQGQVTGFWVEAEQISKARLEAISKAKSSIQFETFFMTPGHRADDFALSLAEKAQAGVKIQLITDSYGAKSIPQQYWQRLQATGVEVRFFNPFSIRAPLDYLERNHRKLLLIDGQVALIGGAGVSDHWDGMEAIGDQAPWLDYEVSFQGAVISRLEGLFLQHWLDVGGTADLSQRNLQPNDAEGEKILVTPGEAPSYRDSSIRTFFQSVILSANKRVWIASPYFLPNANSRELLLRAKRQGVDVRILTMGPHTDKKFVYYASRELYGYLLSGGVEIHEYQPSMMHAKVILVDDSWVSIGSANLDPRSFFRNDELNLFTAQEQLFPKIERFFLDAFSKSCRVNYTDWQRRSFWEQLKGRFFLLFYWQL